MGKKYKKICIFGGSALGDSIAITPFLRNIKSIDKNVKIYYFTSILVGIEQLENVPYIDTLIRIDRKKIFSILNFFVKLIFCGFEYVIYDHSFSSFSIKYKRLINILTPFSKHIAFENYNNKKYFDKIVDYTNFKINIVQQYKEIVDYIYGEHKYDDELEFFVPLKRCEIFDKNIKKGDKTISIFLSGDNKRATHMGVIHRSWDNDKWIKVINYLIKEGFKVFIIGGKDNQKSASFIKNKVNSDNLFDLTGVLSLGESSYVIKKSDIYMSTDSGPLYIAMSFKKTIIALISNWTPNIDSYITYPIRSENVKGVEVLEVIELLNKVI